MLAERAMPKFELMIGACSASPDDEVHPLSLASLLASEAF